MDESFMGEECKMAINNVIWMYAPPETTLKEAENMSYVLYQLIAAAWDRNED